MKILCVGDVVGSPGRAIFAKIVPALRASGEVQAVVVNAENAAAGRGITAPLAEELFSAGADVITLGDHTWDQKEGVGLIQSDRRVVRPANFGTGCPGRGWTSVSTPLGELVVISLIGRTFMNPADNPFTTIDDLLKGPIPRNCITVVDFHAEATSEKICLGHYLDGRVSAVFGTHTHVQTADAKILPKGSGYITDLGMSGPYVSVIGRTIDSITKRFITGMPTRFDIASGPVEMTGCIFDIDPDTRLCRGVEAVRYTL